MNDLTVINQNGQLLVDSREVAQMIDKQHSHLLRDIKGYVEILTQSNFGFSDFFIESTYKDSTNRKLLCYLLTRKGCDMVANKMTGEKGVLFTATYVTKFEEMERQIQIQQVQLSKEVQAIFLFDQRTMEMGNRLTTLENTMTINYSQQEGLNLLAKFKVINALGGKDAPAYKEVNKKAFSELWRHYKRVLQVNSYRNTAVKDYEKAKGVIANWKPNRDLELMIIGANSQIR